MRVCYSVACMLTGRNKKGMTKTINEQFYDWLYACPCKFKYNDKCTHGNSKWIAYEFNLNKPPTHNKTNDT